MMRQKGFGKKILSLALAAAMSVSLCAPAWAEEAASDEAASSYTQQEAEATHETGKADDTLANDDVQDVQQEEQTSQEPAAAAAVPMLMSQAIHNVSDAGGLQAALKSGNIQDGDIIVLAAGTYQVGTLKIDKAVNLQGAGADKTKLQGTIIYGNTGDTNINGTTVTVQGIGFDTQNQMALCFSTGVTSSTLNIADCAFANSQYAVNVNSGAAGNTLSLKNTTFTNTWCAIAVKDGNTLNTGNVSVGEGVVFAVQKFGTDSGNKYYLDAEMTEYVDATQETVTAGQPFTKVASIGSAYYSSLASAFAAAADGETITLLEDADNVGKLVLSDGRAITVNLNNHDVAFQQYAHFEVRHGTLNLEGAGTAYEKQPYYAPVMLYGTTGNEENYSVVNVGKDVTLRGWSSVFIDKNGDYANGVVANVAGTLQSVKDTSGDYGHAVYVNGTIKQTNDTYAPQIHLLSTARIQAVDEEDATKGSNGIYLAGYTVTTIDEGVSIESGAAGIEIRAGKLIVNGGTIESTAVPTSITPNGNGSTTEGAALAVSQHTTALPLEVTINGGTFRGYTALYENCVETTNKPDLVKVTVNNGNFATTNGGVNSVYADEPETMTVSGGYYTNEVNSAYIKDDKLACNLLDALYEGVYAYQVGERVEDVSDVTVEVEQPEVQAGEIKESEIPDITGVDKAQLATDLKTTAEGTEITQDTAQLVSSAALVEANVDGDKVTSEAVKEKAVEALNKKAEESSDQLKDDAEITITVTPVLAVNPLPPVVADDGTVAVPFDIQLQYKVTASAETEGGDTVEVVLSEGTAVANPPVMDITIPGVPVAALGYSDNVESGAVAADLYVRHDHESSVYYYRPEVTVSDKKVTVTFTNPHGFSDFTLKRDSRTARVAYPTGATVVYTPTDIGASLMSVSQSNFAGWTFAGVSGGPYKVMTEELLTALANAYQQGTPISATAVFTENASDDSEAAGESNSTPSSTPAPVQNDGIVYYTCPACGYHDWTATAEGYQCNHCGYIESVKQLSGYGNVKGVYEPKTSTAAAQTGVTASGTVSGAIPQTGDEQPVVALVVVAVAALLGLGVTVAMKKRNNG